MQNIVALELPTQSSTTRRYYTNNMGLEVLLHSPTLLTVQNVINFARCIVLLHWLQAYLLKPVKID